MSKARKIAVLLVVGLLAAWGSPDPAHAAAAGHIEGPGGMSASPGLTTTAEPQSVGLHFDGVGTVAVSSGPTAPSATGMFSCGFSGTGVGSIITGSGTLDGQCEGGSVGTGRVACVDLPYTYVGLFVVFGPHTCSVHVTQPGIGTASSIGTVFGHCYQAPLQTPPMSLREFVSYCELALLG